MSAFVAYILNMALYGKLFGIPIGKQIKEMVQVLLPSVLFYFTLALFRNFVHILWIEVLFGVLIAIVYYLLVLPLFNIRVYNMIVNFIRRR